jgi:serine protease inhibitor
MNRKAVVAAVVIAAMSIAGITGIAGIAGAAENPVNASYFEGTWSGEWDMGPSTKQDVTVTIGEKNQKGYHKTTYDYGFVKSATGGTISPGSFVVYGKEQDGAFIASWKNKEGMRRTLTMKKYKDDEVKARYDIEGSITSAQRPYYDAILKRR